MIMYNDAWNQLILFLVFFAVGVISAFIYDTFRVSENITPSGMVSVVIRDVLFWLVITVFVFVISLKYNNGEIRFFMLWGVFLGSVVYFCTVSRYVVKILVFIINLLKKALLLLLNILLMPLKLILRLINKPVFYVMSFSKRKFLDLGRKIKFKLMVFKKFKRK